MARRFSALTRTAALATTGVATLALAGCMGPTYGTGKSSTEQLFEDVSSIASLSPPKREPIAYNPRPELVRPSDTSALPEPQQNVASASDAWPESPEERRARLRKEADDRFTDPSYESGVRPSGGPDTYATAPGTSPRDRGDRPDVAARQAKQNRKVRTENTVELSAAPSNRRYLTDPPVEYRQPSVAAPAGELGEDERIKERRRVAAAKGQEKKSWRDWIPWE